MRFSLATLVLVVLWIGAAMWVWAWRKPWFLESDHVLIAAAEFERRFSSDRPIVQSPDGHRVAALISWNGDVAIFEKKHGIVIDGELFRNGIIQLPIAKLPFDETADRTTRFPSSFGFIDDNSFAMAFSNDAGWSESEYFYLNIFRRHFPEWWRGHFYRPEVWLFLALSGALLWRFVRWRRKSAASKGAA